MPVRINIVTLVNSINWGDVTFDPALPAENARGTIDTVAIAYTRTLSIAGRSANVGLQIPLRDGHVEGLYLGVPTERGQFGFGDPRFSLGVNLYGAPAMTPQTHAAYRMRTIVGASLTAAAPFGQYDDAKLLNPGSLDQHQAFRASVSRGAYTTIGGDFTSVAAGYNYAWAR